MVYYGDDGCPITESGTRRARELKKGKGVMCVVCRVWGRGDVGANRPDRTSVSGKAAFETINLLLKVSWRNGCLSYHRSRIGKAGS